ncbi:MAG: helix-turn-helix domain-containing protein [Gemmiger sp.]
MNPTEAYPLRVEAVQAASCREWRTSEQIPPRDVESWQLVYVRNGAIEERCDERRVLVRQAGILLHQPGEVFAMRVAGEIPPEVLRVNFLCTSPAMDAFRERIFHAEPAEQVVLDLLCEAAVQYFVPPENAGDPPAAREELPFGALQELTLYLEHTLLLLHRRLGRARKPSARVRRERRHQALVNSARSYFAQNLTREVRLEEVCTGCGCTRQQLQEAFRARTRKGPMETFAAMRLEYAAQLLGRGATPGEVARQLGYCSGAYFSQRFRDAYGMPPSEYRRLQQGLPAKRQQKHKEATETSIPEKPDKG